MRFVNNFVASKKNYKPLRKRGEKNYIHKGSKNTSIKKTGGGGRKTFQNVVQQWI